MSLVEINWQPESRTLRQFGAIGAAALPVLAWWTTTHTSLIGYLRRGEPLVWDAGNTTALGIAITLSCALVLLAWLQPRWLKWPFVGLSLLTAPIGFVLGELLLAVMFYVVFLAVGLTFRLLGRNPLQWRFERERTSYWQPKSCGSSAQSYFQQF
jgi:hypothetical protein